MSSTDSLRIKLLNVILNHIGSRGWKNYDNFAEKLVEKIISSFQTGDCDLSKIISKSPSPFFRLNSITKDSFLSSGLIEKIEEKWKSEITQVLDFESLFPEMKSISEKEATALVKNIEIPEEDIQNTLRKALRLKSASPIPRRGKDSSLEIADIEHFRMTVGGRTLTFAAVVKGYKSVGSVRLSWKDIANQVTRAYSATRPDYILLLTALEPKDGLITALTKYAQDVGNPNLIIFVPPMDLVKFLKAFSAI
jgi:hypothetical protein